MHGKQVVTCLSNRGDAEDTGLSPGLPLRFIPYLKTSHRCVGHGATMTNVLIAGSAARAFAQPTLAQIPQAGRPNNDLCWNKLSAWKWVGYEYLVSTDIANSMRFQHAKYYLISCWVPDDWIGSILFSYDSFVEESRVVRWEKRNHERHVGLQPVKGTAWWTACGASPHAGSARGRPHQGGRGACDRLDSGGSRWAVTDWSQHRA